MLEAVLLKLHAKLAPRWVLIQVNFHPIQEIGSKVGGGCSFLSGPFFMKPWYIQIVTALLYIKLIRFSLYFCSVAGDSSKTAAEVLTAHVREISLPDHPDDPHQPGVHTYGVIQNN